MPAEKQYLLLQAAEQVKHTDKAYVRADGEFFLFPGNKHTIKKPLRRDNPEDEKLIRAGKKWRTIEPEGLYIGANPRAEDPSKKMVLTVTFEEVIAEKNRILENYLPVLETIKKRENLLGKVTPAIDIQIDLIKSELK